MKVALVSPYAFDAHGGVQDQVRRLVGWLRDAGHEAWAVAPGTGGPDGTRSVGSFRSIPANRSRAPISVDPRAVKRIEAAVADADVVHLHEPFMPMVGLGTLFADTPPVVGTFHADPGAVVRGVYRIASPLLKRLADRAAVVTAVSDVAAAALPGVKGVRVIPNGIDVTDYEAVGDGEPGRVVFVGRDDPRKGLDVLLAAWPRVMRDAPGAELRVVGAHRDSGPLGVSFLGRLEEREKRAEMAGARVLVSPNLGGESFGIVLLESLATGRAVVASDLPAFRAVAGKAARFVPVEDPIALAGAIATLLLEDEERSRLAAEASRRARMFDRSTVLPAYTRAYEDAKKRAD